MVRGYPTTPDPSWVVVCTKQPCGIGRPERMATPCAGAGTDTASSRRSTTNTHSDTCTPARVA
jgi:hypothetical protein